jgi:hypothetical protein
MGRVREQENGPRLIDLDILLFGDEERDSEALVLPHPRIAERAFVILPLLEIEPSVTLPDGSPLKLETATVGAVRRVAGPLPDLDEGMEVPVEPTEWAAVAQSEDVADRISGFDAALRLKAEVLRDEGIPVAWEPYEPGLDIDPFGAMIIFRIMVPVAEEERAKTLLAALADSVPIDESDDPLGVDA